jgi:hypothetical protein
MRLIEFSEIFMEELSCKLHFKSLRDKQGFFAANATFPSSSGLLAKEYTMKGLWLQNEFEEENLPGDVQTGVSNLVLHYPDDLPLARGFRRRK